MSESDETNWRLGTEPEEVEDRAAGLTSEEDEKKEELQHTIQTNVEELGGGGEGSLITGPEEIPITEAPKKKERMVNVKRPTPKKRVPDSTKSMVNISKQLERQATQLARIEKVVLPLQKSVNRIDKQSNTMKQLYTVATQLQRQVRSTKNRKQNQGVQRKRRGKSLASSKSKKRSLKGRR
jgi:hypothetical protein